MTFGIYSDALPLFLGEEQCLIFQRLIRYEEITRASTGHSELNPAQRYYKEIRLGPAHKYPLVFTECDYSPSVDKLAGWNGGGTGIPGSIDIADTVFYANPTDAQVFLRDGSWWLSVLKPDGATSSFYSANYYVFYRIKDAEKLPNAEYGIEISSASGQVLYRSDWDVVRPVQSIQELPEQNHVNAGGFMPLFQDRYHPYDICAEKGRGRNVGKDKLVYLGYRGKFKHEGGHVNSYTLPLPIINDGFLSFSAAFICPIYNTNLGDRHGDNMIVSGGAREIYNPIPIVINKPTNVGWI
ncbi:hypothetical protein [Aggregatibacter kilianii]|uniref:hypothetical protein n=1 Tax=Aggregatibacter kilianii TaxID=2025884 RepID=UPI000D64E1AB|nr:hypothetical protein [Aggregatibacter kilianii]